MKILIDINHPAHVHYFRNFISIMELEGHTFTVTNRDDRIINELLDHYEIAHLTRRARPTQKSRIRSLMYLASMVWFVFKVTRKVRPDFYMGFASPACAINGFLFRKPSIIIDDTEHNNLNHSIYSKFCSVILTPHFFEKNMGKKHIRFKAYVEQFYLHSKYFKPKNIINKKYALIRYISYDASHDHNVKGIATEKEKLELVEKLSEIMNVYVSAEFDLSNNPKLQKYQLNIHPSEMLSVIANSTVFISEGATMASEAGVLGVPYYYINPLHVGYIGHQARKYKHANKNTLREVIDKINDLNIEKDNTVVAQIENDTINPTELLIYFVKNFASSKQEFKNKTIDKEYFNRISR